MKPYLLSIAETYKEQQTRQEGLTQEEVRQRQKKFGKNEIVRKRSFSIILLLLHQFKDIMIFMLLAAALISYFVGNIKDVIVILVIVVLNAIIGFIQEYRAEKAVEALKKMTSVHARIRREGKEKQVTASEIVPGDIVVLEAGMIVPADIRLTKADALKMEEASLSGESEAVEKHSDKLDAEKIALGDRLNMAYKTTIVSYGRGEGIVVATGMNTEIGKISQMLEEKQTRTPLQKRMALLGKRLSVVIVFICLIIYGGGLLQGVDPMKMILTAISVAVAGIPEALPAVITIALALGARQMVRYNALIRKLPAVETLGSVTYICSDKTGTITENKMKVTDVWMSDKIPTADGFSKRQILLLGMALNHDLRQEEDASMQGDPTELALLEYARSAPEFDEKWPDQFEMRQVFPFDSERKRMTVVVPMDGRSLIITKGAVESILSISDHPETTEIKKVTEQYAEQGKRVIAYGIRFTDSLPESVGMEDVETGLLFAGLAAMIDPPREEAIRAIADCYTAGITPVMITGDHPTTAKAIAKATGILKDEGDKVISGAELAALSEAELEREIKHIKVYARVSPRQKMDIVKALQKKKQYVAMTGDGVNDAPALRAADIGVAMGISGTDVSREAADMILLDDNFATIIKAVKEGRRIYDNIRKFIMYTMTSNSGEIWTIFLAPLVGLPMPLIPIQILWINLVTDGLPGLAFTSEPAEIHILERKPRKPGESIFSGGMGIHILWVGLLMAAVCIGIQAWAIDAGNTKWMTMVFTVLSISQMIQALAIRSSRESFFTQGMLGNKPLLLVLVISIGLQIAVIYIPYLQTLFGTQALSGRELSLCLALSTIVFFAVEIEKWFKRRLRNNIKNTQS